MATDYLLGGFTLFLSARLLSLARTSRERSILFWAAAFLFTSLAAFVGGTYHAFAPTMSSWTASITWAATLLFVSLASVSFLIGAVLALCSSRSRQLFAGVALLKWLVFFVLMMTTKSFLYAILEYGSTLLIILGFQVMRWRQGTGGRWFVAGVVAALIAALIQQSGITFHRHFNYNDLYHLVQMLAMWLFYRRGRELRDRM